ncbi:MAG: hypothetical protein ACP5O2_02065 [Bacteroidales bacterium]
MTLRRYEGNLWIPSSAAASLWAAIEIVLGSFLHNLRIPFSGSILTFFSIGLMTGFLQLWPYKGFIWKTGLITAILKSVSPSHIILGPMIGIMSEALLMELSVRIMGNNLFGITTGGILSMNASLIHKVANLLIMYGWNITNVYLNLYKWLSKQAGWLPENPLIWVIAFPIAYAFIGAYAGWLGLKAGKNASLNSIHSAKYTEVDKNTSMFLTIPNNFRPIPLLIILHFLGLVTILLVFGFHYVMAGFILSGVYLVFAFVRYKNMLRRFKKPALWLQFIAILAMALIFGTSLSTPNQAWGENLIAGLIMIFRAAILITALSCIMAELHSPVIQMLASKSSFRDLVRAIETTSSTIPWVLTQLPTPMKALKRPLHTLTEILQLTTLLAHGKDTEEPKVTRKIE